MKTTVNSKLCFDSNYVYKTFSDDLELEDVVKKHEIFYSLSSRLGFRTAAVEPSLSNDKTLVLKRIEVGNKLTATIRDYLQSGNQKSTCETLASKLGVILAEFHRQYNCSGHLNNRVNESAKLVTCSLPSLAGMAAGQNVILHGDFTLNNMFHSGEDLTILDPMPNYHTTFSVLESASAHVDFALYANSVLRQIGVRKYAHRKSVRAREIIGCSLKSYNEISTTGFIRSDLLSSCVRDVDLAICRANKVGGIKLLFRKSHTYYLTRACIEGIK